MAPEQKPSVGRIVRYHTRGSADGVFPPTVFAAIITELSTPDSDDVGLVTFGPSGMRFENKVAFGEEAGQWSWPPRV